MLNNTKWARMSHYFNYVGNANSLYQAQQIAILAEYKIQLRTQMKPSQSIEYM